MLEVVGYPVKFENGEQILNDIAKYVTSSNEQAEVAKALKKIYEYDGVLEKYGGI